MIFLPIDTGANAVPQTIVDAIALNERFEGIRDTLGIGGYYGMGWLPVGTAFEYHSANSIKTTSDVDLTSLLQEGDKITWEHGTTGGDRFGWISFIDYNDTVANRSYIEIIGDEVLDEAVVVDSVGISRIDNPAGFPYTNFRLDNNSGNVETPFEVGNLAIADNTGTSFRFHNSTDLSSYRGSGEIEVLRTNRTTSGDSEVAIYYSDASGTKQLGLEIGNLFGSANEIRLATIDNASAIRLPGNTVQWLIARRTGETNLFISTASGSNRTVRIENTGSGNAGLSVQGALSKGSGTFDIAHPDSEKKAKGIRLRHSFVESPTAGDNIYRYQITTQDKKASIDLPDYFNHLNENPQVWITAVDVLGFGRGAVVNNKVEIETNVEGTYNILVIGTRKDKDAKDNWDKVPMEYDSNIDNPHL